MALPSNRVELHTAEEFVNPSEASFLILRLNGGDGSEMWRREIDDGVFGDNGGFVKTAQHLAIDQDGNIIAAGAYPLADVALRSLATVALWRTALRVHVRVHTLGWPAVVSGSVTFQGPP